MRLGGGGGVWTGQAVPEGELGNLIIFLWDCHTPWAASFVCSNSFVSTRLPVPGLACGARDKQENKAERKRERQSKELCELIIIL